MGRARHHWRKTDDACRQDSRTLWALHRNGKRRWQLRQTRVARSVGTRLLLLSPRRSDRSAHHSSQSVRHMKNRIGCRNPDRWIAACPAVELLPGGPTEDFTRDVDNLHLLTTLNSPQRGGCANLIPATRSSNQSP